MATDKSELLQGTLDLLILKALQLDPMHGFGLSNRIRQMSAEVFQVEMGSLYPALCRLEARDLIAGEWGTSESNRRARYYRLTAVGRKQLREETAQWEKLSGAINLMLRAPGPA
jgi:transcriptional regulator